MYPRSRLLFPSRKVTTRNIDFAIFRLSEGQQFLNGQFRPGHCAAITLRDHNQYTHLNPSQGSRQADDYILTYLEMAGARNRFKYLSSRICDKLTILTAPTIIPTYSPLVFEKQHLPKHENRVQFCLGPAHSFPCLRRQYFSDLHNNSRSEGLSVKWASPSILSNWSFIRQRKKWQ